MWYFSQPDVVDGLAGPTAPPYPLHVVLVPDGRHMPLRTAIVLVVPHGDAVAHARAPGELLYNKAQDQIAD